MNNAVLDVIVVGSGHAGLSASFYLKKYGLKHIVFEQGKIGESWRSQRWNTFTLNTANKLNVLPGDIYTGNEPEGFPSSNDFVSDLRNYVTKFDLPVKENAKVLSIEKAEFFKLSVYEDKQVKNYQCRQVIIASGIMNQAKIPSFAEQLSPDIKQLHASEYRHAKQLPSGGVLVVGSAQSGCQVAEDLVDSGRKVYLSTSMVPRVPRWYRGCDIMDWLMLVKFFDVRPEDIPDPKMLHMRPPQLTGTGDGRRTISLQVLSEKGAIILGKMENADGQSLFFQPNAPMHVKFADDFSKMVKDMIDEYILKNKLSWPPPCKDEADLPDIKAACATSITSLNMDEHDIRSIIWTTGFGANFSYIKLPIFDVDGNPRHSNGMSDVEGLYFLGFPWLRTRKSSLICGIKDDAEYVTGKVMKYARKLSERIVDEV